MEWKKYAESNHIDGIIEYYWKFENNKLKFKLQIGTRNCEFDDIYYLCDQFKCEVIIPALVTVLNVSCGQYYVARYNWANSGMQFWQMIGNYYWRLGMAKKQLKKYSDDCNLLPCERLVVLERCL